MTSKHYACINGILAYIHCTVSSETIKSDPFAVALTSIMNMRIKFDSCVLVRDLANMTSRQICYEHFAVIFQA